MRLRVRTTSLALISLLVVGAALPAALTSQECANGSDGDYCDLPHAQQLRGEAISLGVNALLGGVTAGVTRHVRGGSFWDGFRGGALGGVAVFAGKRLVAEPFPGSGLLGRGIAATGSSVIRNTAAGQPYLSDVVLPIGPTRLYLRPRADRPLRVQIDVIATVSLAYAMVDADLRFDLESSLSSGAAVFRETDTLGGSGWRGSETGGVVRLSGDTWIRGRQFRSRVLAHERVHVLQYDQSFILGGRALESALLPLVPGGAVLEEWLDFGLDTPFWAAFNHVLPYEDRPWETEADLLGRTRGLERAVEGERGMVMGRDD